MKKIITILCLNLVIAGGLSAQEVMFSILLNKGDNSIKIADKQAPVMIGSKLHQGEILSVKSNGYVALVYEPTGAGMEIKSSGEYAVSDLAKRAYDHPSSVLAKYGKYLIEQLNPEETGSQNLNVTGAVERGDVDMITINLPKVTEVYGNKVIITWKKLDDMQDFVINIRNSLDEEICSKDVTGNRYTLNLDEGQMQNQKMIILNVSSKNNEDLFSPDYGIQRLTADNSRQIEKQLADIKKIAGQENTLDKLYIASFFEENNLIADALGYYNQAMALSPDRAGFYNLYNNFLTRNGLKN